ncbi:hypothetical protein QE152_g40789 [Popillia japonica]|uniref:Endonuclease/exonuclease/phosphatase domain-containing protein n=1 Tax=Popillia japonica TaxID=7064 RepID=A0AAW1HFB7_POPJA
MEGREGALGAIIKCGQVELDIWCIYINGNMNEILGWIAETTGGANGDRKVIIGGDWNARTGIMGDPYIDELGNQVVRESKDKVVNGEGRKMIGWLRRNDWRCLNGWAKDDWGGEYTYVGARGSSVIDYVVVRFGEVVSIDQLMECVRKAVCKKERRDGVKPGWFDAECVVAKRGLREAVSRFRLSQIDRMQLLEEQGRYERTVDRKKNEWEEREIEKIRGIKVESEVWDIVKRVKGSRRNGAVGITMSEWEKYFRELLDGV